MGPGCCRLPLRACQVSSIFIVIRCTAAHFTRLIITNIPVVLPWLLFANPKAATRRPNVVKGMIENACADENLVA